MTGKMTEKIVIEAAGVVITKVYDAMAATIDDTTMTATTKDGGGTMTTTIEVIEDDVITATTTSIREIENAAKMEAALKPKRGICSSIYTQKHVVTSVLACLKLPKRKHRIQRAFRANCRRHPCLCFCVVSVLNSPQDQQRAFVTL